MKHEFSWADFRDLDRESTKAKNGLLIFLVIAILMFVVSGI